MAKQQVSQWISPLMRPADWSDLPLPTQSLQHLIRPLDALTKHETCAQLRCHSSICLVGD